MLILSFNPGAFSQVIPDSATVAADSLPPKNSATADTITQPNIVISNPVSKKPANNESWELDSIIPVNPALLSRTILQHHPYFGFKALPVVNSKEAAELHHFVGKEWFFYLLIFLLIVFALLKNAFPKYFADLFRVFFRTTLKQRQISEQLAQTPLPSLLLNGFFIVNAGLYIAFLFSHYTINPVGNFWLLSLYCCLGLSVIYFAKFIGLKAAGWLFNMKEAAEGYIFIVFVINKMIGIILIPFLILLAFTQATLYTASLAFSWCLLGALLFYRVILTYIVIRNQVSVNPFHFFLYLAAFEIAPLLLIYKALLEILRITT